MAKPDINNTFDKKSEYDKKRTEVMDEEQIKLGNKVLDWFRSSHKDKESRGIFDRMERVEAYWEGDANPPESDTDPASNTNIINSSVEGQVAYLVEQNIAIEAKARGPSDLPFRDQAVNLMEWCKDQNRMVRKIDVHERRRKKFGVGVLRVLFDPDALDGFGLPLIENVNPAYIYPDPVIKDIYKMQEGRFFIEVMSKSIEYARDKVGDEIADAIMPGYHPMEYDDTFDELEDNMDEIAQDHFLDLLAWTRYRDEETGKKCLRLIEMSACGVILRDTMTEEHKYVEDDNRYPYFLTPDLYREGTVWAKGSAELLIPVQDLIDEIDDQIRINARLTGNPQRELDVNSGVDPDKITNDGGIIIPSNGTGMIKYLEPPEMPSYIIQRRNQAFQEKTIVSRFSDQMNGVKQAGVDTATESLGLQQGGSQSITHDQKLFEETLAEVFEYALVLMMENYTEEEIFEVTEKKDEFMSINPSSMREIPVLMKASQGYQDIFRRDYPNAENVPDWMPHPEGLTKKIALNIKVTVGAGLPSNKAFVMQMIDNGAAKGLITPPEYRKLMREYTGLPIDENPPAPPMPPGIPMGPDGAPLQNPMVAGLGAGGAPMMPGVI